MSDKHSFEFDSGNNKYEFSDETSSLNSSHDDSSSAVDALRAVTSLSAVSSRMADALHDNDDDDDYDGHHVSALAAAALVSAGRKSPSFSDDSHSFNESHELNESLTSQKDELLNIARQILSEGPDASAHNTELVEVVKQVKDSEHHHDDHHHDDHHDHDDHHYDDDHHLDHDHVDDHVELIKIAQDVFGAAQQPHSASGYDSLNESSKKHDLIDDIEQVINSFNSAANDTHGEHQLSESQTSLGDSHDDPAVFEQRHVEVTNAEPGRHEVTTTEVRQEVSHPDDDPDSVKVERTVVNTLLSKISHSDGDHYDPADFNPFHDVSHFATYQPEVIKCNLEDPRMLQLPEVDEVKEKYVRDYSILPAQYDLVHEFYQALEHGGNLDNELLRALLADSIKDRKEVKATEEDVSRALAAVDGNHDDKITLDEFVRLLLLFFSSKQNVKERIASVLGAVSRVHEESEEGKFGPKDLAKFAEFLYKFYGKLGGVDAEIDQNTFEKEVLPELETATFVQWSS